MEFDIEFNLRHHIFYHGTRAPNVEIIRQTGFKAGSHKNGQWVPAWGLLGNGIYISCNWRTALWFGRTLLRVKTKPGIKLLNVADEADRHVLSYLKREFGAAILKQPPFKVLPKNKKLTLTEVVALVRYHYSKSYAWVTPDGSRESRHKSEHAKLLNGLRSTLIHYGYHGFGDPNNDVGIVIFSPDHLKIDKVLISLEPIVWCNLPHDDFADFPNLHSLQYWWSRYVVTNNKEQT